ncbi:hypothetical protein [Natronoglycomyces albus]|uniref:DUF4878 domain-containing protein n=1 Tax=Natronoglycomyces albus TaxID=2811108 RepID=A0A895XUV7_9ACTN|nr:hypothetical protein [Natronoglycomyces albus]QSB06010.1 hypothetical protein JQS30_03545 [Natronoglycomyces albus]
MSYPPPAGGQQPGWDPNQQPPQQPGYPPQQQPGYPQHPPMGPPPGGGVPPGGMPPSSMPPGHQPPAGGGGGGYPPYGAPQGGYPGGPPPKKSSTGLIIGIGAGALVLVIAIVLVIAQPWASDGPRSGDSPESVAEQAMEAFLEMRASNPDDIETAANAIRPYVCSDMRSEIDDMVAEAKQAQEELDQLEELGSEFGEDFDFEMPNYPNPNLNFTATNSTVDGDTATVEYEASWNSLEPSMDGSWTEVTETDSGTIELKQEDGTWLVCEPFSG